MLIVKGIAVGTGLSAFYGQVQTNHATGLSAVKGATLWNPVFWLGIILAMDAGFALVRFRVIK